MCKDNMAKKMLIDATHAEETRVVVVDGNKVEEFDFETQTRRQIQGNIYLAKVMRVEPSLQAAFVDYGGNRHGFLAFSEIHPDYYQIPVADREALLAEEEAYADAMGEEEQEAEKPRRRRSRSRTRAARTDSKDAQATQEAQGDVSGMEVIDLEAGEGQQSDDPGSSNEAGDAPAAEANGDDNGNGNGENGNGESGSDESQPVEGARASLKDSDVESIAAEDESEDIRPRRKPRMRKYKIQEVVKVRQIMLIQVVKEERGNKGAALTTYLSLAGRYCVLMPNTARGGGISRKITNAADRKKLKEIAQEIEVPKGAGLIIRTAGSQRTRAEIKRDYEYLQRLWEQIRQLTLKSTAPAKIYAEGDLIKRSIRDLYNREIDEVVVEGEAGYRVAKDFMKMIMPSHARHVKHYQDQMPLYARHQVESHLTAMFNPTVQLPSGGYIVIGITEALVAIDVNSGKATKEGSIEQTALKTNLEAADEVARQLRLRDLAGLIVVDFIDMDERKNNLAVEKRFKDKLKSDRARIQVGKISGFGLLEMSRQRLRPGMLEATTQPCPHCHGTGLLRSDDNVALTILRALEEEGVRGRSREVLLKVPVSILNYLINHKREHIVQIEARYGMAVRLEADLGLVSPDFALEKFKTASRTVAEPEAPVVTSDLAAMADLDEAEEAPGETETEDGEGGGKPRRRRRRRRGGRSNGDEAQNGAENGAGNGDATADEPASDSGEGDADEAPAATAEEAADEAKKPRRRRRRRKPASETASESGEADDAAEVAPAEAEPAPEGAPEEEAKPRRRTRSRRKPAPEASEAPAQEDSEAASLVPPVEAAPAESPAEQPDEQPEPLLQPSPDPAPEASPALQPSPDPRPEPAPEAEAKPEAPAKPKRRGWWNLGR